MTGWDGGGELNQESIIGDAEPSSSELGGKQTRRDHRSTQLPLTTHQPVVGLILLSPPCASLPTLRSLPLPLSLALANPCTLGINSSCDCFGLQPASLFVLVLLPLRFRFRLT